MILYFGISIHRALPGVRNWYQMRVQMEIDKIKLIKDNIFIMNINDKINKIALLLVLIILNCKAEKKQEKPIDTVKQEEVSNVYYDPSDNITNETCAQIYKLWAKLRFGDFYSTAQQESLENSLIDFLRTEESWSIDVEKEMPFIEYSVSEDNMVRIYSWYFDVASGDTYFSIIQYKAESGIINAIQVSGYYDERFEQYRQLGFYQGPSYYVDFKIEKYTYLIGSQARAGGFMSTAQFLAVRLLDGKIEPYKAFNGDNELVFSVGIQYGGTIDNFDFQFDKKPYWIRIMYNVHEDPKNYSQWILDHPSFERYAEPLIYDYLEFYFNGTEFIGDYKKFKEVSDTANPCLAPGAVTFQLNVSRETLLFESCIEYNMRKLR
jgi:hypothetical protein